MWNEHLAIRPELNWRRYGLKALFYSFAFLLIAGCSGIGKPKALYEEVLNSNFNSSTELPVKEIFSLDSSSVNNPTNVIFDSEGQMYVKSYNSPHIKVFGAEGNFIKHFKTSVNDTRISSVSIINDTLFFTYGRYKKVLKYLTNGEFKSEKTFDNEIPNRLETIGSNRMIGSFRTNLTSRDNLYLGIKLKTVDNMFRQQNVISSYFGSYYQNDIDYEIDTFPFAVDKKNQMIYVGIDSDSEYNIYCYGFDLKLKRIIKNDVPSVKFSEAELENRKNTAQRFRIPFIRSEKKLFIESMDIGPEGYLYIRRASDADINGPDKALFDVFDPAGKHLSSFILKNIQRAGNVNFKGRFIYVSDPIGSKLTAYEIENTGGAAE